MTTVEQTEVRQVEDRRIEATIRGDLAELDRILADDLTYVHGDGRMDAKAQYLAPLRSGAVRYESVEPEDVTVRGYGDTSILTGLVGMKIRRPDRLVSFTARFTSVYQKRQGCWQMVAYQATRLPER